jgi:uncharacterized protein YggE
MITNRGNARLFAIAISLLAVLASGCTEAAQPAASGGIQVNGHGSIEVVPDMGRVTLQVRREGSDAAALTATLNQVTADLIAMAGKLGIEDRDITATALSISPRYRRRGDETVADGVVASRSMELLLRDLDRFIDLMNQALALGANNVEPIRLDTSERQALEDQALALAMADAKAEAGRVADGFGVKLGPVTNVVVGAHSPRPEAMRSMMADSAPSFSAGVIQINRTLSATFAILTGG